VPVEPPPSRYHLPDPAQAGRDDVVAVGGDLEPGTVLQAYRRGLFPMHLPDGRLGWWSPVERGVVPLDGLRVSRSLRRSIGRYRVSLDRDFAGVIRGCADPRRPHGWITPEIVAAYGRLHELGWVHSVEVWDGGELVGGLYGVAIGGAFFGESMFHRRRDASKVALVHLVDRMRRDGADLLDVQWATEHLVSLGAMAIPRLEYLERLREAITRPLPTLWAQSHPS
jgi:leucyl/phenylalanyl-tRNA---protein transferase